MALYRSIADQITTGKKNNLREKIIDNDNNNQEFRHICRLLEKDLNLNKTDVIGLGTSCVVIKYGTDEVVKICSKRIKFFKHKKKCTARLFKKTVDPLFPYLLPVKEILYDGDEFFVYTQDCCRPLPKKKPVTTKDIVDILTIIKVLFDHQLLVGQLKPKNVGYFGKHLVLFDFHSMHPLKERMEDKIDWWKSLVDSLNKYCQLYNKGRHQDQDQINFEDLIEELQADDCDINIVHKLLDQAINRLKHKNSRFNESDSGESDFDESDSDKASTSSHRTYVHSSRGHSSRVHSSRVHSSCVVHRKKHLSSNKLCKKN